MVTFSILDSNVTRSKGIGPTTLPQKQREEIAKKLKNLAALFSSHTHRYYTLDGRNAVTGAPLLTSGFSVASTRTDTFLSELERILTLFSRAIDTHQHEAADSIREAKTDAVKRERPPVVTFNKFLPADQLHKEILLKLSALSAGVKKEHTHSIPLKNGVSRPTFNTNIDQQNPLQKLN